MRASRASILSSPAKELAGKLKYRIVETDRLRKSFLNAGRVMITSLDV
jgi:hypothetical protein